jgi:type VI protein secretion system component VasK
MKKSYRSVISVFLVVVMLFNTMILQTAVYAQDADDAEAGAELISAQAETQQATDEVSNVKSQLDSTKKISEWGMSSSTKKKIRNANQNLNSAKTEVNAANDQVGTANTTVQAQSIGDAIAKGGENTLSGLAKIAAAAQSALIKLGKLLQSIGSLLKSVGALLKSIGSVLSGIPWTAAIGAALTKVGGVLTKIGYALDAAGKAIEAIGNTASLADQKFGDLLGTVVDAAKQGWQAGTEANAQTDATAINADTIKGIGDAGNSIGSMIKGIFQQDTATDW